MSAHKVFAASDPFSIYSEVLIDLYFCILLLLFGFFTYLFLISIVHSLALVSKKHKCLYSWNLILKYSLSLKPLLDRWLILQV